MQVKKYTNSKDIENINNIDKIQFLDKVKKKNKHHDLLTFKVLQILEVEYSFNLSPSLLKSWQIHEYKVYRELVRYSLPIRNCISIPSLNNTLKNVDFVV